MTRAGIVVFPGSNCDRDCERALAHTGFETTFVWHRDTELPPLDLLVIPGGFSYGDYLRAGAIAKVSPIMGAVKAFAKRGGLVLGICNGFQILLEVGLLPGAMTRNASLHFICRDVNLRVEQTETPFTGRYDNGAVITVPIAHGEGNYRIDEAGYAALRDTGQIVFRYCDKEGVVDETHNPNGSLGSIAGICNRERNVLGMMPHPERLTEPLLGGTDGALLFQSVLDTLGSR